MSTTWPDLLADSLAATHQALLAARRPYVSVSGGKDSMVVAHIALQLMPDIEIIHSIHGMSWLPTRWPGVLVAALTSMGAMDVRVDKRNLIAISRYMAADGYDLVLIGLRRGESAYRRRRMESVPQLAAIPELWPIAGWSDEAVWSYIRDNDVPYASAYDEGAKRWPPHSDDLTDRCRWERVEYRRRSEIESAKRAVLAAADERAASLLRFRQGAAPGRWVVVGPATEVRKGATLRVPIKAGGYRTVTIARRASKGRTFLVGGVPYAEGVIE